MGFGYHIKGLFIYCLQLPSSEPGCDVDGFNWQLTALTVLPPLTASQLRQTTSRVFTHERA